MKKIIYFLRHGETEFNKNHIVQGSGVDSNLNETGIAQGKAFFDQYHQVGFEAVLTSTLKRTHQTVQSFIDQGIHWEQFSALDEMSWGIHEGKKGNPEMRQNYLDLINEWNAGNYDAKIEEGESAASMEKRVSHFLNLLKSRQEEKILVCSHGRTMTCISTLLEERPLKDMVLFKHYNTGLTKTVLEEGKFIVELKNDISHLQLKS